MDAENLLTAEQVLDACDENTIAVIVTFGQTFTGSSRICR
jgi:glutamate decarboxylase